MPSDSSEEYDSSSDSDFDDDDEQELLVVALLAYMQPGNNNAEILNMIANALKESVDLKTKSMIEKVRSANLKQAQSFMDKAMEWRLWMMENQSKISEAFENKMNGRIALFEEQARKVFEQADKEQTASNVIEGNAV